MVLLSPPGLPTAVDVPDDQEAAYRAHGWRTFDASEAAAESGPPPRAGRGSSADAWAHYAAEHGVTIADGAGRDEIIAACEAAGVPTS